jgi:chromosomal replication initiation ATPase DnaA
VKQLVLPLGTRVALGREDFIVAPCNRDAVAFLDSYPDWPAPFVAIYGPAGSGKSHLVAAWSARAMGEVVDASALDAAFLHRAPPAVAIENIDTDQANPARDQLIFSVLERGGVTLLTGREHPSNWPSAMPDLASRYRAMLSFALWEPDEALLESLVHKLFSDRQLIVTPAVVEEMLQRLERSPAAVHRFVARLDALALAEKRPVTAALMKELLSEHP